MNIVLNASTQKNVTEKSLTFCIHTKNGTIIPPDRDISSFFIRVLSSNLWKGEQRGKLSISSGPTEACDGVDVRVVSAEVHYTVSKNEEVEFYRFCQNFSVKVKENLGNNILKFSSKVDDVSCVECMTYDAQSD